MKSSAVFFTGQVNLEIKGERICNLGVQLQSFGGYGFLIHDESSQSCVDIWILVCGFSDINKRCDPDRAVEMNWKLFHVGEFQLAI